MVERGHIIQRATSATCGEAMWQRLLIKTPPENRLHVVVEVWCGQASLWPGGSITKGERVKWKEVGYESRYRNIKATQVGGAIQQERLLVARVSQLYAHEWTWDTVIDEAPSRRPRLWFRTQPRHVTHVTNPLTDPMPWGHRQLPGGWMETDKGYRQIQVHEVARALGATKGQVATLQLQRDPKFRDLLLRTKSVFHGEYLSGSLVRLGQKPIQGRTTSDPEEAARCPCQSQAAYHTRIWQQATRPCVKSIGLTGDSIRVAATDTHTRQCMVRGTD
ncbi:hypothetical protein ACA910_012476 [Epithemia clementina (nom. ined.)]